jgi:hypothetical protein
MSNIINNNKPITGTATKDRQQSMGSANNEHSVSSDMDIEMGTTLSSGQDVNALSNDDALHSVDNACSEDALPHYYDDIIMSNNEFDLQLDGDECPSLGKEHQVKLLNEIKQLRFQLYRVTTLSIRHIIGNGVLASKASALKLVKENYPLLFDESNLKNAVMGESSLVPSDTPFMQ